MKPVPVGPVHVEVFFDEDGAIAIHGFGKFDGILLGPSRALETSDSFLKGRVDKNVKSISPFAEIVCRASADNHACAGIGDLRQDSLNYIPNTVRVHHLQSRGVQASFEAPTHKGFEQPIIGWIPFLFMLRDHAAVAIQAARDLFRQQLVPQLPTKLGCYLRGNFAASASVLAFEGDYSNGHSFLASCLLRIATPQTPYNIRGCSIIPPPTHLPLPADS